MARNLAVIRLEAIYRSLMLRFFYRRLGLLLVTEYPKSGGSWVAQMLSDAIDYPFPRQSFPPFGRAIYHGHRIADLGLAPVVVVWRDPRDIMVSWYYHTLFVSDKNHPGFVARHRHLLDFKDYDDIRCNLPRFIEFNFETPLSPKFSFNDFFDRWYGDANAVHCRYEDLLEKPEDELMSVCQQLGFDLSRDHCQQIVQRYSFTAQASRSPGHEDKGSYLRKGVAGDWKNHFNSDAIEMINRYLGHRLKALRYLP